MKRSNTERDERLLECLQRIATATELMVTKQQELVAERDQYRNWYTELAQMHLALKRRMSAMRGQVTRLKRKGNV